VGELPSGTVTFLFTDLEGSTRLWEKHPDAMRPALARHDAILREAVAARQGHVVKTTGDGMHAVFATAHDALAAAVVIQLGLAAESFGETGPLRVRIGVHTCEAEYRDGDYYGSEVNRAARLMSVAHGDQIVVSSVTSGLVRDGSVELVDLGEHRLRDLTNTERVFQVHAPGLVGEFPPLRSLDLLPGNLPRQVTTFVGRQAELASLAETVRGSSLVTLTGVGGVGKTRLALQVAAEVIAEFPDGAWMCELAPVTDPGAVWDTLAACLRVQAHPGRSLEESVLEYLAPKRLLLVLDNCEHLLDAVARVVDAIAQRCERVVVLATSREGLALGGERIVAVPSLGVPPDGADLDTLKAADAVQLFSDRANAARSDFVLSDRDAGAVGVLCRRLDGIPLAIELAAARVRSLSPDDLVARLDQRFKLLTRGSRAALERHQTLRSTIDWSYDLLAPPERRALERLSVFAGGCDLTAAEAVLATDDLDLLDVVDVLGQLVDKSLVVADVSDGDAGIRYRLLESIRQYAQERLQDSGESAAVRRRHADYYVALAETSGPHLRNRDQVQWGRRALRDVDNFRAALDWAVETPSPEHALRLVAPFTVTGIAIGDAARDWADVASTIPGGDDHPLFPTVAGFASLSASFAGELERAETLAAAAERAQARLGSPRQPVLQAWAILAIFRDQLDEARADAEAWVELARAADDPYELVLALIALGGVFMLSAPDNAIAMFDEAVRVGRDAGIASSLSVALPFLASMLPIEDSERASALLDEAIEVGTALGDRLGISMALIGQASISVRRGEWQTTLRTAVESVELKLQLGDLASIYGLCYTAGVALCGLKHYEPAAVLIGKADVLDPGRVAPDWLLQMVATTDAAVREALGEQQALMLAARGAGLEITAAVTYLRAKADEALTSIAP
jgi:predicted ATPase/class 3 adenylate cyclase